MLGTGGAIEPGASTSKRKQVFEHGVEPPNALRVCATSYRDSWKNLIFRRSAVNNGRRGFGRKMSPSSADSIYVCTSGQSDCCASTSSYADLQPGFSVQTVSKITHFTVCNIFCIYKSIAVKFNTHNTGIRGYWLATKLYTNFLSRPSFIKPTTLLVRLVRSVCCLSGRTIIFERNKL